MISILIVDDEEYAREELSALLQDWGDVNIIGSCANALEAIKLINSTHPQVLFLDIKMPVLNGFDLLGMIDEEIMPYIVFVTAFDRIRPAGVRGKDSRLPAETDRPRAIGKNHGKDQDRGPDRQCSALPASATQPDPLCPAAIRSSWSIPCSSSMPIPTSAGCISSLRKGIFTRN